jgi:hypothetical protein
VKQRMGAKASAECFAGSFGRPAASQPITAESSGEIAGLDIRRQRADSFGTKNSLHSLPCAA